MSLYKTLENIPLFNSIRMSGKEKNIPERSPTPPVYNPSKSYLDYLIVTSRVMKDKTLYALWNLGDFQSVDRCYPGESYYSSLSNLLTLPASHMIDNIYVGSAFNAADWGWLTANEIKIIVNVTPSIGNYYPNDMEYHNYAIKDLNDANLGPYYEKFYQLVENNPKKRILVHCFAGKSRSASLVIYYLMKKYKYTMDEALNYLKERRPQINLNCKFLQEIKERLGDKESANHSCPYCSKKH